MTQTKTEIKATNSKSIRREKIGIVVSDKMDKTITVAVGRRIMHPKYKKFINRTSNFKAHDEKEQAATGDRVLIYEVSPLSKTKRWKLAEILEVSDKGIEVKI